MMLRQLLTRLTSSCVMAERPPPREAQPRFFLHVMDAQKYLRLERAEFVSATLALRVLISEEFISFQNDLRKRRPRAGDRARVVARDSRANYAHSYRNQFGIKRYRHGINAP